MNTMRIYYDEVTEQETRDHKSAETFVVNVSFADFGHGEVELSVNQDGALVVHVKEGNVIVTKRRGPQVSVRDAP